MGILILIYGIIVTLGFGEVLRFPLSLGVEIKPLDVLVLLASFLFLISYPTLVLRSQIGRPLLLFTIVGLCGLLLNRYIDGQEFSVSLLYLLRFISVLTLFPMITNFPKDVRRKLLFFLTMCGLFITLAGFIQYAFYSNLRNLYYLGWDDHMYRLFSVFLDPNFAACFFNILFFMFLTMTLTYYRDQRKIFACLTGGALSIVLFAEFLTYSRSGLIMLVVSSLVFFFLIGKKKLILPLFGFLVIGIIFSSRFFYIENLNLFRSASSVARITSAREALALFTRAPLLGTGFNAYKYAQVHYGYRKEENALKSHADGGTDNSFLLVLVTTGIVGFISFLWLWRNILNGAYRTFVFTGGYDHAAIVAIIVGLVVDSFFINSLFYTPILVWVMMLLGSIENT